MLIEITEGLGTALTAAHRSLFFMLWNTFLALIPLGLSLWLFNRARGKKHHARPLALSRIDGVIWWLGLAAFIAFLPNAPYVLTDIIHLIAFIRDGAPLWVIVLVLIPQYLIFMLVGTEAYVLSLVNMGRYLDRQVGHQWVRPAELTMHVLCAVGIYLGRFPRFNSWDIVTAPGQVVGYLVRSLFNPQSLGLMLIMFVLIAAIYWPLKQLTLAMMLYLKSPQRRQGFRRS